MQLKEFGCDLAAVTNNLSDADEQKNYGFRAGLGGDALKKLTPDECNSFKIAQMVARDIVNDANSGTRGYGADSNFGDSTGSIPLWWRAGVKPKADGRFSVGDTTFYSYDPRNNTPSSEVVKKATNRNERNPEKAWHCGM